MTDFRQRHPNGVILALDQMSAYLQATMMRVMPIIFTFMFLFAPAGLVIYWLMNNVLSIGQQYFLRSRAQAARSSA